METSIPQQQIENYGKLRKYPIREGYYSVTSIINYVFGTPPEIVTWSVKRAATAIYDAIRQSKIEGTRITKSRLLEIGEQERFKLLKAAGVRGSIVHDAAQSHFSPEESGVSVREVPEEFKGYYNALLSFTASNEVIPILQERVVCSHTYKYAGRFDMYCRLWGRLCLIDYKTSSTLHAEYGLQLAAYRYALEGLGYPVERSYILHLRPSGTYSLVRYNDRMDDFVAVRECFERKVLLDNPAFEIASDYSAARKELHNGVPKTQE